MCLLSAMTSSCFYVLSVDDNIDMLLWCQKGIDFSHKKRYFIGLQKGKRYTTLMYAGMSSKKKLYRHIDSWVRKYIELKLSLTGNGWMRVFISFQPCKKLCGLINKFVNFQKGLNLAFTDTCFIYIDIYYDNFLIWILWKNMLNVICLSSRFIKYA